MLVEEICEWVDVPAGEYLPGINQTIRFVDLIHHQDPKTGRCNAIIVTMPMLELADGTSLEGVFPALPYVDLVADNNTILNTVTGEFLAIRERMSAEEWDAEVATLTADDTPAAYQGDFFWKMRKYKSEIIDNLILYHMEAAVRFGKYQRKTAA